MSESVANCCGDESPKGLLARALRHRRKVQHIYRIKNPIAQETADSKKLKELFKGYKLVPYAGTSAESSHSLLRWYRMLAKLSPTNAACINKKLTYAVGGKAQFVRAQDPEYDLKTEISPLSNTEIETYLSNIKEVFEFPDGGITAYHNCAGHEYMESGNAFVEVAFTTVLGVSKVSFRVINFDHVLYVATNPGEARKIAISPIWDDEYLRKHEPRILPIFPVMLNDNGIERTVFHLKNGSNEWYGRPPAEGADIYKYREVQDSLYVTRASANNFTGKVILETEDDDPNSNAVIDDAGSHEAGFDNFAARFRENYTEEGDDPQSVVLTSRPHGARPMFAFQIKPHTNESWYKETGAIAKYHILQNHEVTPRFLGEDVSNGFSNDTYLSDYILNVEPTIDKLRSTICNFTNRIFNEAWAMVGRLEMQQYSVTFSEPIRSQVDQYKAKQQQNVPPTV